jgi:Na+/citrate or Na+/malate symporter
MEQISILELIFSAVALCLTIAGYLIPCAAITVIGIVAGAIALGIMVGRHLNDYPIEQH